MEEVYQEILSVWCGNYWGRSAGFLSFKPFIDSLNTSKVRQVTRMFTDNNRVQEELYQSKPKAQAIALLTQLKAKLTISAHKDEVDSAIDYVKSL